VMHAFQSWRGRVEAYSRCSPRWFTARVENAGAAT
jgi:hypothetical protein